jgi:hypothetical protein
VGTNTDVVLHDEFKGSFDWGNWVFYSRTIPLESGLNEVEATIYVPYQALDETISDFCYVYVTLPGDEWGSQAWDLTEEIGVYPLEEFSHDELVAYTSARAWGDWFS